jgi:hypothetical protein
MQEKNVRGSIWWAVASFILGLAGFLVSGLFLYPLMQQFDLFGSLIHKLYTENWTATSTVCGLLGWGAGFLFLKRGGKKGWLVTSGMVLSILAILGGYPFMMLMAWLLTIK